MIYRGHVINKMTDQEDFSRKIEKKRVYNFVAGE